MDTSRRPKIALLNIPSGMPSEAFPIAISRVIDGLDPSLDAEIEFIDVEYYGLSFDEIKARISAISPQIIGFSAILTHAYSYLKELSLFLRSEFPDTVQVLGGQMSVLSNLIIQRTEVDFCVTGESEPAFSALIARLRGAKFDLSVPELFSDIKGLVFMSGDVPYFTGHAESEGKGLGQMNYGLMSKFTDIERFFPNVTEGPFKNWINKDEVGDFYGFLFPGNVQKRIASVFSSKGCVGRCTFCHRFFKGYASFEPSLVISHIDELAKKRDIGFIQILGELFGCDKKKTEMIVDHLKLNKLNWSIGAIRVNMVDESAILKWREAGCVLISFGIESCSQKMLDVMEKRTTVEENLKAIDLCFKHGVFTAILLLIGMPGETEETISETIRNLIKVIPEDMTVPYEIVVNYFQPVPGTPGYEYARNAGLIGPSLEAEEQYVKGLYGVNANNIKHYLNFTDYEKEETAYWKHYIFLELITGYIKKHGLFRTLKRKKINRYKYAAIYMLAPAGIRRFLLKYGIMLTSFGLTATISVIYRKIFKKKKPFFSLVRESLREVNKRMELQIRPDDIHTHVLRKGR
ncbi:MAG: hypothetical protein A2270_10965 [Elusimicrobia bacterium RIFOXYA12_FULL_51_18]|nr:MAG: hypothetical protein A2270_10965 [Elusimicrobia bacterium RIFOXYA12_FULL_51_18]OGS32300.1 MAG: hypothetical protein A2218_02805 [Elusimicrobia bacterium RIFOXYA2_FULL_53_38]